jgi:hypothetical protein
VNTYKVAYDTLRAKLARLDPQDVAAQSGARVLSPDRLALRCLGREYEILYPEGTVLDADGAETPEHDAILLLLYLTEATGRPLEGRWVAFEQLVGGAGYIGSFRTRVVAPVLRSFGHHVGALAAAAAALDGEPLAMGDAAVLLQALPRLPLAFIVWAGDDEFPPTVNVVFDGSAEGYLDAEAVTVLAEMAARRLEASSPHPGKGGVS